MKNQIQFAQPDFKLLKRLFAIYSPSGKEDRMANYLCEILKTIPGVRYARDHFGNIFTVKGKSESYPCVCAHIDQVADQHSPDYRAVETRDMIFGYSPKSHSFENCGADDKVGVLFAIQSIMLFDNIKIALFRDEERGCRGSGALTEKELTFFNDCRFILQADRRGNSDFVTNIGSLDLCSEKFIRDVAPEMWGYAESQGMLTDVHQLKESGVPCSVANISCGYYEPHLATEHILKSDVVKAFNFMQHIIIDCSDNYPHEPTHACYYDCWEIEDDIYAFLGSDPNVTAQDLYEWYHGAYPYYKLEDFQRIIDEYRLMYGEDEYDNYSLDPNEKENNQNPETRH